MTIARDIIKILEEQAYDRGHSAGREEVTAVLDGLLTDFKPILKRLNRIEEDIMLLQCLRNAGVDNWEGWDDAIDCLEGRNNE